MQRRTIITVGFLLIMTVAVTGRCQADDADTAATEVPAVVFRASDILKPQVLEGLDYKISERVPVVDDRFLFEIDTTRGTLPAHGVNLLALRLQEMDAIHRASQLSRRPQIVEGLFDTLNSTPDGARILLRDPVGTILSTPDGVRRMLSTHVDPVDRRAGSDVRRKLAVSIGCDPETNNPILTRLLNDVSRRKGLGQLAGKAGLSVALPGLGLLPTTAQLNETIASKLPHEINADIDRKLAALGVAQETRQAFLKSASYTTTQRLHVMHYMIKLADVPHSAQLIDGAAAAKNESAALAVIQELKLLNDLHQQHEISKIVTTQPPVAELRDGRSVTVWSADYINDPQKTKTLIAHSSRSETEAVLITPAIVGSQASETLRSNGIKVIKGR